mmetsp:Transcript_59464/g.94050  ORF Transcript_59464/g.94050 Transcript_59464/m.94050 type:complete len:442 (+) Transcript_59464:96-1421(+)
MPAQRQDDMSQASSRPLGMSGLAPGLPEGDDALDAQLKAAAPPGLSMPLNAHSEAPTDDPGELFGSIDIEESGANGPLRFKVVLARKGPGRLGIDVVLKREANFCGLLVYTVSEGGRVDAWNRQSQMPYRVLPGDHILEVNDISISGDSNAQNDKFAVRMIQELSKDQKNVHFTVERAPNNLGEELVLQQDDETLVLPGDLRRRVEEQTLPRQVGAQRPDGQEDAGGGKSAQMRAAAKVPLPKASVPAPRWQPKGSPLPPGQTEIADGEADEGLEGDGEKDAEEEEDEEDEQVTPSVSEDMKESKDSKEETTEKDNATEAPEATPTPVPKEAPPAAEPPPEPAPSPASPPATAPAPASPADKAPPVKAKPVGAGEMSPPPKSGSRPLPPPPKTVAPVKPGDVSKAKAKAEPKEAEAKISVPAPPSGPAPPPPELAKASPQG